MNILLVDDDVNVLESLQRGIDYESLGIDRVYAAETAMEAREILNSVPVNILVTDIEMPQESGIDLLKWTKDQNMNIVTIFCTGYADFNYAKKAVELQCFDYYLKPVTFSEFESIIKKAVDKVKEDCRNQEYYQYGEYWLDDRKNRKESFWGSVLLNIYMPDSEYLTAELEHRKLEYRVDDCFDLLLLSIYSAGEAFRALTKTMNEFVVKNTVEEILKRREIEVEASIKYGEDHFIIVTRSKETADWVSLIEELGSDFQVYLKCRINVFYDRNSSLQVIRTSFEKLEHIRNENLLNDVGYVDARKYKKAELTYSFTPMSNWESYLSSGNIGKIVEEIKNYLDERQKKNELYTSELKSLQADLIQMIHATLLKNNIEAHELFADSDYEEYRDHSYKTYGDYLVFCKYILDKAYGYINYVNKSSSIVVAIKQYIEQHYSEEITRNDLAETVYLNSDYMARLFKKEEGCSITDYVIKVRMEKASVFLAQTNRSINEIALDCGYDNFAYFSRVFKRIMGYAPKEYRNRLKADEEV